MTAVSAVDDFEEVAAFINVQFHQSKVIYNKQIESSQLLGIVQIFACNLSLFQLIDQCAGLYVSYGMEQPQCTDAQGANSEPKRSVRRSRTAAMRSRAAIL